MLRPLLTLAVALAAVGAVAAEEPLRIRWHGQSFFEIVSSDGVDIVTDPHAIEAYGRKSVRADLLLMSHLHTDHTQTGVISNFKDLEKGNRVFNALKKAGRDPEFNKVKETYKKEGCREVRFYDVPTYHDELGGMVRGKNGVWVIEVDGLRIVHLGDLGHKLSESQIRQIGEVDILMIPVGGVYTLNGLDAARVVEQLKPKRYILPMHYGTEVYTDLLGPKYFLEEMKEEQIKKLTTNELAIDPKGKIPEEPLVVLMKWGSEK